MVFDAKVNGEAAILQYDGTGLSLVVLKSHVISFSTPDLFIPVILEGDLLAIYTTIGSTEAIFMNQTAPAEPIITGRKPPWVLVEPGAAVTLEPTIIGQDRSPIPGRAAVWPARLPRPPSASPPSASLMRGTTGCG